MTNNRKEIINYELPALLVLSAPTLYGVCSNGTGISGDCTDGSSPEFGCVAGPTGGDSCVSGDEFSL